MNPSDMTLGWNSIFISRSAAALEKLIWMWWSVLLILILVLPVNGQSKPKKDVPVDQVTTPSTSGLKSVYGRPANISTKDLADFEKLPAERKLLIEVAIAVATEFPWLPYLYGGADPSLGGLDCSGAMYYVMNRAGLVPPRTSAAQYLWLKSHQRLHLVAAGADTTEHPSLRWLKPGDLIFWSTDKTAVLGEAVIITHVAMYLGRETRDARKIMINSTDGRSYRGTKSNGYGIYDFKMPVERSKSKLIGYGTPPGIPEIVINPTLVPKATESQR